MKRVIVTFAGPTGHLHDRAYEVEAPCPLSAGLAALDLAWPDAQRSGHVPAWPRSCDGVEYDAEIDWIALEQEGVDG
jgi:hypothetical protein